MCVQPALRLYTCWCKHGYSYILLQKSGQVVLSMDALFGLPRKKSAGHSLREAIHGHLFFRDQSLVDEFVALTQSKHNKSQKVYIATHAIDL